MLEGRPTIVVSYSTGFRDQVAKPLAERLELFGFRAVLVGEEPHPPGVESNPNSKVEWFFHHANMAVFLATPDDHLASGETYTRQNIIDEHRLGQQLPHLKRRLLVFKARDVSLPSNINPVYEQLPLDDPDWVANKVIEQARIWGLFPAAVPLRGGVAPTSSETDRAATAIPSNDEGASTLEAIQALRAAIDLLEGKPRGRGDLHRAELAVSGLIADTGGEDTLGVHLANTLFAHRHDMHLRRRERLLLLRTYLRHSGDDNVPGAFWISDLSRPELIEHLLSLVHEGGDPEAQAQAVRVLGKLGAPRLESDTRALLNPLLASDSAVLRAAALDYLQERNNTRMRTLLDDTDLLTHDRLRVSQVAAMLDVRSRPSDVMERYITDDYVRSSEIEDALINKAQRVRRDVVLSALTSPVSQVRLLGIRMANKKGLLSVRVGRELIEKDRSPDVRIAAARCLAAEGKLLDWELYSLVVDSRDDDLASANIYTDSQALRSEISSNLADGALRESIRFRSVHGPSCYEALGVRNDQWRRRNVRRDIRSNFARLRDAERNAMRAIWVARSESTRGRPLTDEEHARLERELDDVLKPWNDDQKLGTFMIGQFTAAALRILVKSGRPTDVDFARRFAGSSNHEIRVEALRLFERFGTSHDVEKVIELARQMYDRDLTQRAAATALRLAHKKDRLKVLNALREIHWVSRWSVERLADVKGGIEAAWQLLWSDDADVRLAAAKVVWDVVDPTRADEALSVYISGRHFYNVTRAIDRRLYAPDWLGEVLPT